MTLSFIIITTLLFVLIIIEGVHACVYGFSFIGDGDLGKLKVELESATLNSYNHKLLSLQSKTLFRGWYISAAWSVFSGYNLCTTDKKEWRIRRFSKAEKMVKAKFTELKHTAEPQIPL